MRRTDTDLGEAASRAHGSALLGDLAPLHAVRGSLLGAEDGELRAWALCLDVVSAMAASGPSPLPGVTELRALPPSRPAMLACAHRALAAAIDFDLGLVDELADVTGELAARSTDPSAALWLERARVLGAALRGESAIAARIQHLGREAQRSSIAEVVIEASVLGALDALSEGAVQEATARARRASRMARAEGIVQHEYFANVVLARVRRAAGRAPQAKRILSSLQAVVPSVWRRWLEWELAFAAAPLEQDAEHGAPARAALARAFAAAREGRRDELERSLEALSELAGDLACTRLDVERMGEALDPSCTPRAARGFCLGEEHRTLEPVEGAMGGDPEDAPAYVLAGAGVAPRRVLASGLGLLPPPRPTLVAPNAQRRDARVLLLLSVLALRGEAGISEADLFGEVYGFRYSRSKHEGVLRVLIHRARAQLGTHALIERTPDGLALRATTPIVIPDPRSAQALEERVMHYLGARSSPAGAKEVAEALGISVRAAQRALRLLADEGACETTSNGRGAQYRLEDTTFLDPTRSRVERLTSAPA